MEEHVRLLDLRCIKSVKAFPAASDDKKKIKRKIKSHERFLLHRHRNSNHLCDL